MRLYTDTHKYNETIEMANNLTGTYEDPVIFHCFWHGPLNEKHFISILSCFYFNVLNKPNRKIILWTDSPFEDNNILKSISQFCEIRYFDFLEELKDTEISDEISKSNEHYQIKSDRIRYILLYKYGGVWFDLDMFILKSFDTLLSSFKNDICVYTWSDHGNYPNGAIFINLIPGNPKMKHFIDFLVDRNKGYGFQDYFNQESNLTYDTPVDLLVLPSSWFNAMWLPDFPEFEGFNKTFFKTTDKSVTLDNFCKGAFSFHWHNMWFNPVEPNSYFDQLANDLVSRFKQL